MAVFWTLRLRVRSIGVYKRSSSFAEKGGFETRPYETRRCDGEMATLGSP